MEQTHFKDCQSAEKLILGMYSHVRNTHVEEMAKLHGVAPAPTGLRKRFSCWTPCRVLEESHNPFGFIEGPKCLKLPNKKARPEIIAKFEASSWHVQNREEMHLTPGRGIAVRETPMKLGFSFANHLLYLDRKAVGAVE